MLFILSRMDTLEKHSWRMTLVYLYMDDLLPGDCFVTCRKVNCLPGYFLRILSRLFRPWQLGQVRTASYRQRILQLYVLYKGYEEWAMLDGLGWGAGRSSSNMEIALAGAVCLLVLSLTSEQEIQRTPGPLSPGVLNSVIKLVARNVEACVHVKHLRSHSSRWIRRVWPA